MKNIDDKISNSRLGTYYRWKFLRKELSGLMAKTILDVGCNYALFVEELSKNNLTVGIDVDQEAVAKAKKRNSSLNLFMASACEIPFRNESMDCVLSLSMLEHIRDDQRVISEISRVLKPGGSLILTTTHENFKLLTKPMSAIVKGVNRIFKTTFPTSDDEYVHFGQEGIGHVRVGYSKQGIQKMLKDNNLKMIDYGTYWGPPTRLTYPPLMLLLRSKSVPRKLVYFLFDIAIHLDNWIKDEKGDIIVRAIKE